MMNEVFQHEAALMTPFRILTTAIFFAAVIHTLFANFFTHLAEKVAHKNAERQRLKGLPPGKSFWAEILSFLGEVEIIFGLWVVPLLIVIFCFYDWGIAINYLEGRSFIEPIFVVVIMTLASTRPIVKLAEYGVHAVSQLLGNTVASWWITILTLGPLLGSFITEVGAMTLCAVVLDRRFYALKPSKALSYATLGLLFVNISVGGLLTNFASPPVLIVARLWNWTSSSMFSMFGWKVIIGILFANALYWWLFRKELKGMQKRTVFLEEYEDKKGPIPFWMSIVHVFLMFWVVFNAHYPEITIGSFLMFLGFHKATHWYQSPLNIKRPLLVGMFLAGIVIHGGLQGWWITPLLENVNLFYMMTVGMVLTAFNDNATITYLTSLLSNSSESIKYIIVSGSVAGGGLTVIANAPNPVAQSLLKRHFRSGVSPWYLFLAALIPTGIFLALFFIFRV